MSLQEAGAVALLRKFVELHKSGDADRAGRYIAQAEGLLSGAPAALEPTPQSINRAWLTFCDARGSKDGFSVVVREVVTDLAVASASGEREKLLAARIEQLEEACEPGRASGIVAGMFRHAESFGHSPVSAKHGLTYLVEEIVRLRSLHAGTAIEDLPFYAEWAYLKKHGQWREGVPHFARDHNGRMNDGAAMQAVIAELVGALGVGLRAERMAQMLPYAHARSKLPDACYEDASFARMSRDFPGHMADRILWLSKALDALVPEVTHAVAWQARSFHADDPDEHGNCWGLWHGIDASSLDVHLRRVVDNPEGYQIRPLFTQPAGWISGFTPRGADQPARELEDMTGWQPWRAAFEVYWASMCCAPGTDPTLLYNMKNAALDAWRTQEEKFSEPSTLYVGIDAAGQILSIEKRSDLIENVAGVQSILFWDVIFNRAVARCEAPAWDITSLLSAATD